MNKSGYYLIPIFLLLPMSREARAAEPALQWSVLADGGANSTDYGTAATIDPGTGDLIVAGEAQDGVAGSDIWVRRLDRATGAEIWGTTWGVSEGNDMACTGVIPDGHGCFLVGGFIRGCET